jgi:ABC-transporter N-terminal
MSSYDGDRGGTTWDSRANSGFQVLRAFTAHSSQGCCPKRVASSEQDIEKGSLQDNEHFDLRDYLTAFVEANRDAGIQGKHVGVIWENLQVAAPEGQDDKVR